MSRATPHKHVYTIVLHKADEGGYWTEVPALPGAGSQGESIREALEMTRESIDLMIETLEEDGTSIPEDTAATREMQRIATPA